MSRTIDEIKKHFASYEPSVRQTSAGVEVVLRRCPIDLKGRGSKHPDMKFYINPEKGIARCFYCHSEGTGVSLEFLMGPHRRAARKAPVKEEKAVLPPLPRCTKLKDMDELLHPAWLYLNSRSIDIDAATRADLRWKGPDVPSWVTWTGNMWEPRCEMPGLVIPVRVRRILMGWQLCPVPRIGKLKYITAPGSSFPLYNFDHVKETSDVCVIFEGVFDVLTLPDVSVGLFTDKINKRKRRLLSTGGFREIVICLDTDRDETHVLKQVQRLRGCAPIVRSVRLPSGDPNDYESNELREILGV